MTKAELIDRVYGCKQLPRELTKKTVALIVDAVFTEMGDYFIRSRVSRNQGARLTYPGSVLSRSAAARPAWSRTRKTGVPITIPQQATITFSPGQELRGLLNPKAASGRFDRRLRAIAVVRDGLDRRARRAIPPNT